MIYLAAAVTLLAVFLSGCAPMRSQVMKVSCNTKEGPIGNLNLHTGNAIIIKGGSVLFINDRGNLVEVKDAACGVSR